MDTPLSRHSGQCLSLWQSLLMADLHGSGLCLLGGEHDPPPLHSPVRVGWGSLQRLCGQTVTVGLAIAGPEATGDSCNGAQLTGTACLSPTVLGVPRAESRIQLDSGTGLPRASTSLF